MKTEEAETRSLKDRQGKEFENTIEAISEPYTEEDLEDLKAIEKARHEPSEPMEKVFKELGLR